MVRYRTTSILELGQGQIVHLNEKQASNRSLMLTCLEDGKYLAVGNITFKHGEIIGFDEVPDQKSILVCLTPVDEQGNTLESVSSEVEVKPSRGRKKA
jgi:hypothetical protein